MATPAPLTKRMWQKIKNRIEDQAVSVSISDIATLSEKPCTTSPYPIGKIVDEEPAATRPAKNVLK